MLTQPTKHEREDAIEFKYVIEAYNGKLVGTLITNDIDEQGRPSVKALNAILWTIE